MKKEEFRQQLAAVSPQPSQHFSNHVDNVLERINHLSMIPQATSHNKRIGSKTVVIILIALLLCSAAFAATHWDIFDTLHFILNKQFFGSHAQMQKILQQETVNDVEITIHEAMYDGRTLFIQYSYRMLDETEPLGILDANGQLQCGVTLDALEKLSNHNVGWWIDQIWINGQCIDMASSSSDEPTGTLTPGEIIMTGYWRLDNLDIALSDEVSIGLPIGARQPLSDYFRADHPERYDASGNLLQPEEGLISFKFDTKDVKDHVALSHPNIETVLPDVTAKVTEAAFSPLMTYITLELKGNPDALAAYQAQHGESYYDDQGKLMYTYTNLDVHQSYILSLSLVDGNGKMIFPNHSGCHGVGDDWAEFVYPYLPPENMPDELWLAPVIGQTADMTSAIRVK